MSNLELQAWNNIRMKGFGRFAVKSIIRCAAWFSIPMVPALLLTVIGAKSGGVWTVCGSLTGIFVFLTLLIGFGDALVLWRKREHEYLQKMESAGLRLPPLPACRRSLADVPGRNVWN